MRKLIALPLLVAIAGVPGLAWAHAGDADHTHSFIDGILHPLAGLDHLLALVAVGLWAGQSASKRRYLAPVAFVAGMALGLGSGAALALDVELAVAASVFAIGALLLLALEPPIWLVVGALTLAGVFHGAAHASEGPSASGYEAYALGALLMTMLLHATGWFAAETLRKGHRGVLRVAGGATALLGAALLAS